MTAVTAPPGTRARPLPPEERRRAIIDATLPLLIEHGANVSTRQIAEAAGIAEGTIFRAFDDKESLIVSAVETALERNPTDANLAAIERSLPLDERLVMAVDVIQRRIRDIFQVFAALDAASPTARGRVVTRRSPDLTALTALIEPDADRLRVEPARAAQLLHGLVFAGTHPFLCGDHPLTAEEIVATTLHGVRNAEGQTPC